MKWWMQFPKGWKNKCMLWHGTACHNKNKVLQIRTFDKISTSWEAQWIFFFIGLGKLSFVLLVWYLEEQQKVQTFDREQSISKSRNFGVLAQDSYPYPSSSLQDSVLSKQCSQSQSLSTCLLTKMTSLANGVPITNALPDWCQSSWEMLVSFTVLIKKNSSWNLVRRLNMPKWTSEHQLEFSKWDFKQQIFWLIQ